MIYYFFLDVTRLKYLLHSAISFWCLLPFCITKCDWFKARGQDGIIWRCILSAYSYGEMALWCFFHKNGTDKHRSVTQRSKLNRPAAYNQLYRIIPKPIKRLLFLSRMALCEDWLSPPLKASIAGCLDWIEYTLSCESIGASEPFQPTDLTRFTHVDLPIRKPEKRRADDNVSGRARLKALCLLRTFLLLIQ